ncbi:MAG: histidine kinase [Phycisphaerae bacterium]|nr:histidine kinase [Saprospiraceae bacterium]
MAVLLCLPTLLVAQLQLKIERTEHFSFEQGLSDQEIHVIHRDAQGFLWIGTGIGLERYDGYRFEPYDDSPKKAQRLHGKSIAQIGESADGYLYLRYQGSLQFIDLFHTDRLDCEQVFLDSTTGIKGQVRELCLKERGDFFVLSSLPEGLAVWKLNARHRFEKVFFLPWVHCEGEVFRLQKSNFGHFWVYGSRQGLFRTDAEGKVLQRIENKNFITNDHAAVHAVGAKEKELEPGIFYEDKTGHFWLSFKNLQGVFRFQQGEKGKMGTRPWEGFPQHEYFTRLWEDEKGNLLFGSLLPDDYRFTYKLLGLGANGQTFDAASLLDVEDNILHIFGLDFKRQIFLGTFSGIYKIFLKNNSIRHYLYQDLKPGAFGAIVCSIVSDGQGNVFFALEDKNWYRLDSTHSDRPEKLLLLDAKGKPLRLNNSGRGLAYDPDGYLWGTSCPDDTIGQLHRYDLTHKTTHTWRFPGKLFTLCRSRDGRLCLVFRSASGQGGNIGIFDPHTEQYKPYTDANGANPFEKRTPEYIVESRSRNGVFWVGTKDGLVAVDLQHRVSRTYGTGEKNDALNFNNSDILVAYEDEAGSLWLGTKGGGLNVLHFEKENDGEGLPRPDSVEVVDKTLGLCNNIVCGILPDGQGRYILSTWFGLSIFNPLTKAVGNFYKQDGLNHNEFNRFSFYGDKNGRFYFGTINGLNSFQLEDLLPQTLDTKIRLIKLTKYFGSAGRIEEQQEGLDHLGKLVIGPEVSYFQLEFMLTDYSEPRKNQFYVWLEGQDTTWRYLGNTNFVRYNRLPPGRHTLHLRGADAQGNLTETPLTLIIQAEESFYETSQFLTLMALGVAGAVFAFGQWRIRSTRRRAERRARLGQKIAELELKALQAQMNPHFIFNSLGAIQYFIRADRTQEADGFLTKFAQLMRLFLESSKNKYISLAEEIRLLQLYVELEKMRFEGRFEAKFSVDENIDTDEVEIPSMLLQPFVENAINHGLFHKKEKGLLQIKVSANGSKEIQCIVEDDGVGREAAGALREQSLKNYKSRAMQIVHERLEALSQVEGYEVKIEVEDLRYLDSSPAGTRVTVTIPLAD